MTHSRTEQLAQHLLRPVDDAGRNRARLHLLDWMACVAGARSSPVGTAARRLQREPVALRAALMGNVLEMDDVHRAAILHPGPVVWPTVVTTATRMDDMLDAAVRGYEATIAIGATFDAKHYSHWHTSASAGVFGAAVAAANQMGANAEMLVAALGLAGSVTGGLWQTRHEPVMAKQWHIAHAARTGIGAARHAAAGVTGPRFILEGPQGIYGATCDAPRALVLGSGWRIQEVSFKPWGACRHTHPAIDAALQLRERGALSGPIEVATFADAIAFCDRPHPSSPAEAKFSIQHAVAVVADRGEPQLADFEPEAIAVLAETRARVSVREERAITARYPEHFGATVRCGDEVEALVDARGDPERPMGHAGVVAKARSLFEWGGLDAAVAERGISLALEGMSGAAIVEWLEEVI